MDGGGGGRKRGDKGMKMVEGREEERVGGKRRGEEVKE